MSGSFESVRWNAYVHRLDLGLYSHPKEFWGNAVRTYLSSKWKIPSTGKKILLSGGLNPQRCIKQDSEPNTLPTSYSVPSLSPFDEWSTGDVYQRNQVHWQLSCCSHMCLTAYQNKMPDNVHLLALSSHRSTFHCSQPEKLPRTDYPF